MTAWGRNSKPLRSAGAATFGLYAALVAACYPTPDAPGNGTPAIVTSQDPPNLVVRPDGAVVIQEPKLSAVIGWDASGTPAWRYLLDKGERLIVPPRVAGNSTTYLRTQIRLLVLGVDGALIWSRAFPELIDPSIATPVPLLDSGVIVAARSHEILALDPDGTQRWVFTLPAGERIVAPPRPSPNGEVNLLTNQAVVRLGVDGALLWYRLRPVIVEP